MYVRVYFSIKTTIVRTAGSNLGPANSDFSRVMNRLHLFSLCLTPLDEKFGILQYV